jgi:predicted ATP-grasp superfamily ATP-dependent carboligase
VHAVVAGLGLNGLGVVRSLARAGIPVVALDVNLAKPTAATRFGRKIKVPALSGTEFVDALLAVRSQFSENPILILTEESTVVTVSEERARIQPAYRISLPDHGVLQALLDKNLFQVEAEKHGFRVPRALLLGDGFDPSALRAMRYPCVLKPAAKDVNYSRRFAKAYRVAAADEALQLWDEMRKIIPSAILQEWIVGGDSDVYFCLQYRSRGDSSVANFVGRKILQWPPLVGGTASCVPAPDFAAELSEVTDRFFAAMNFRGFCSMEFKRDQRDKQFYMVEPTVGRTDYQEEIATLNGVNIPAAAYYAELGIAPPPADRVTARGWRDPIGYANAVSVADARDADLAHDGIRLADGYFRLDDPMPYLYGQWARLARRMRRDASRQ